MKKTWKVRATKYGRDWKKIGTGIDELDDDKVYTFIFYADSLIKAIKVKWAFKHNKTFRVYATE